MKGFGIYVKNELLSAEHYRSMGVSIWLYLWLLDKMTSVSEKGIGLVLGGKPVTYEEVKQELDMPRSNYDRYVRTLRSKGYITTTRTPYGLVFKVIKAEKIFKNRLVKNEQSVDQTDNSKMNNQSVENEQSGPENEQSNKTIQLDNTVDNTIGVAKATGKNKKIKKTGKAKPPEVKIIYEFWRRVYGYLKTSPPLPLENLGAAEWLFKTYGVDKTKMAIMAAKEAMERSVQGDEYAPVISNLIDLKEKYDRLRTYYGRKHNKKSAIG